MKTIKIKGKDYVMVNERIIFFRENYPDHKIQTQLLSNENGVCVFRCVIANDKNEIVSSGHAYENEKSSFINKTSYIENCETSAIGRALGNFGIGIENSIATAEEVANAVINQGKRPSKPEIWANWLDKTADYYNENGLSFESAVIDLGYDMSTIRQVDDEDVKEEIMTALRSKFKEEK